MTTKQEATFEKRTLIFGKKKYTARWFSTRKHEAEMQADKFRGDGYLCRVVQGYVMSPTYHGGTKKWSRTKITAWIIYVHEPETGMTGKRW